MWGQPMPGRKALLLSSNGKSAKANGYLARTIEQLEKVDVDYVLFDRIMENPIKEVIMEGAAYAKVNGCDFIVALACGVAGLKMSDYGFTSDESMTLAKAARSMQGVLFLANPCEMTDEDCAAIFDKSYR